MSDYLQTLLTASRWQKASFEPDVEPYSAALAIDAETGETLRRFAQGESPPDEREKVMDLLERQPQLIRRVAAILRGEDLE